MDRNKYYFFKIVVSCTSLANSNLTLHWQPRTCVSTIDKDVLCTTLPQLVKGAEAEYDIIYAREFKAMKKYKAMTLSNYCSEKDSC